MMTDTVTLKKQCRPTATLKRLATVEAIFGYIMVPFYVVLQYVFPKQREKSDRQQGTIKGFIATWLKSIGIAVSAGALLAAVASLPRIVVSESWIRDRSSDEEFDHEMNTARDRLYEVLNDA